MGDAMLMSAVTISIIMVATWLISLAIRNASIVDIVWGLGFAVTSWVLALTIDGDSTRQTLLALMVGIWGVRLGAYLAKRNLGHGEDWRYKAMRFISWYRTNRGYRNHGVGCWFCFRSNWRPATCTF